jgi:hypothetical protein
MEIGGYNFDEIISLYLDSSVGIASLVIAISAMLISIFSRSAYLISRTILLIAISILMIAKSEENISYFILTMTLLHVISSVELLNVHRRLDDTSEKISLLVETVEPFILALDRRTREADRLSQAFRPPDSPEGGKSNESSNGTETSGVLSL